MTTREALKELRDNLAIHVMAAPMFGGDHCEINVMEVKAMIEEADAALKEPLRNCDVGTAEEQLDRYGVYCQNRCTSCDNRHYCHICGERYRMKCMMEWAQIPYEAERKGED